MSIIAFSTDTPGQIGGPIGGVSPRRVAITCTDSLSTVTTAGYLNQLAEQSFTIYSTDEIIINYAYSPTTGIGTYGVFTPTISNGVITLTLVGGDNPAVVLPTIANHIATYTNTAGTISEDPATAISGGNIQAGLSGTAGTVASFPATASKGSLVLKAVANTGNTLTTISNAAMGQASVISIPDPGAATANFLLNAGTNTMAAGSSIVLAKATGTEASNAVTASAQAGVITTSSLNTAGGASYAITWTNTFIASTSAILLTIMGGTNTTENITLKATAGSGTSTLTIYNNTAATALNGTIIIGFLVV